jgi:DNA invertase Pin-like site-specific DNA recombinase
LSRISHPDCRATTSGQTLDAQLEQLGAAGCDPVFKETMSGAQSDRPELKKALDALSDGDVLIVTRLDRLARSTRDLLDIVHTIEIQGAKLKALADSGQSCIACLNRQRS